MLRTSWRLFLRTKRVFFPALLAGAGIAGFALYQGSLFRLHGDVLWFAGDLQQACGPLFLLELYLSYEFLASVRQSGLEETAAAIPWGKARLYAAPWAVLLCLAAVFFLVYGILVTALAILFSHLLVRPVDRVRSELHEISSGHSADDLAVKAYTETEQISEEFNKIVTQMRVLDESRQEFVSNVSHELKTPLTSMKVLADSLLMQEEAPVELYKEFMGDIAEEIERENKIITDLLSLVKMDKKAASLNIEPVDINDLLELILKRLRPIASKKNIEMVLESFRPVTAEVDEGRLTLAFTNLVENAIKYNKENGWVHVSLDADHKFFYVKVMDSGMGIPEESLDYIFERFYRVDKSHSNEIDGTGLGLAIAKSAVLVHKGAIKVSSQLGEGTTFSVRIPLNYIA